MDMGLQLQVPTDFINLILCMVASGCPNVIMNIVAMELAETFLERMN
jgi:hypothetical protein